MSKPHLKDISNRNIHTHVISVMLSIRDGLGNTLYPLQYISIMCYRSLHVARSMGNWLERACWNEGRCMAHSKLRSGTHMQQMQQGYQLFAQSWTSESLLPITNRCQIQFPSSSFCTSTNMVGCYKILLMPIQILITRQPADIWLAYNYFPRCTEFSACGWADWTSDAGPAIRYCQDGSEGRHSSHDPLRLAEHVDHTQCYSALRRHEEIKGMLASFSISIVIGSTLATQSRLPDFQHFSLLQML